MPSPSTVRIAPSLLSADLSRLAEQIARVEAAGADLLHLDIMDGHFVPNLSLGVPVVEAAARCTRLLLDTHLMVTDPGKYAQAFVEAGSGLITFHIEVATQPRELIEHIRGLGARVGVALNPGTPAGAILDIIEAVDLVLVMTVWPGFPGQRFIPDCLDKIREIRAQLRPDQWLEVDGGISPETAPLAVAAGANILVAGAAIFGAPDPGAALVRLRDSIARGRAAVGEHQA